MGPNEVRTAELGEAPKSPSSIEGGLTRTHILVTFGTVFRSSPRRVLTVGVNRVSLQYGPRSTTHKHVYVLHELSQLTST